MLSAKFRLFSEGELKEADGSCFSEDARRPEPHREGSSDDVVAMRGCEGNKKHSKIDGPVSLQIQQALDHPDAMVADTVERRKGECDDFQHL